MTTRRLALLKNGVIENLILVEFDQTQVPAYILSSGQWGHAFLHSIEAKYDAIVELADGEQCDPGSVPVGVFSGLTFLRTRAPGAHFEAPPSVVDEDGL